MKIKLTGIKTAFELENFEISFGKKEIKKIIKEGRKRGHMDEDWELIRENEALKKRLNDAHSQMGDLRKQLDAMRKDTMRK